MGTWSSVRISARRDDADDMVALTLDVRGSPLSGAHVAPGQFVQLTLPGLGEGFFAIASPPRTQPDQLELLVKRGSPLADTLQQLPVGAHVHCGPVQGKGFPIERARGKRVLLFATGSGISAVRSLVHALVAERDAYGPITLYFGARHPDAFAYAHELDGWRAQRIDVIQVVSQPGSTGWQGLTGYVQEHVPAAPLENAIAFLCGQSAMVKGVQAQLTRQGLPAESTFTNY